MAVAVRAVIRDKTFMLTPAARPSLIVHAAKVSAEQRTTLIAQVVLASMKFDNARTVDIDCVNWLLERNHRSALIADKGVHY